MQVVRILEFFVHASSSPVGALERAIPLYKAGDHTASPVGWVRWRNRYSPHSAQCQEGRRRYYPTLSTRPTLLESVPENCEGWGTIKGHV